MTRDFDKQRRDGSRPPSRNPSSNQQGDERSSRPARPRLNREMVDRAWENGATRTHADYHPRSSNGQSQSTSNNWRNNQHSGYSSQQTPGGRKPYGQGQGNYDRNNAQRSDRSYGNQAGPNSRPSNANRYNGNSADRPDNRRPFSGNASNPRGQQDNRPPYQRGPASPGSGNRAPYERGSDNRPPYQRGPASYGQNDRPSYQRGPAPRGQNDRPPYQRGPASHGPASRGPDNRSSYQRGPASYGQNGRPSSPRGPEGNTPGTRGAARYERPERDLQRGRNDARRGNPVKPPQSTTPREPNPRWLSRPEVRQARDVQRQQEYDEQFEGDYEQFDNQERPTRNEQIEKSPRARQRNEEKPERHVTRLDDGRVLKGPRPAQRKNAQFWSEINGDTGKLVEQIKIPDEDTSKQVDQITLPAGEATTDVDSATDVAQPVAAKKQARRPTARKGKKVAENGEEKKPRVRGPRPSQKGYSWPTS
jgi:hypothetical protein